MNARKLRALMVLHGDNIYKLTAEQVDMIFFGRGHAEEKVSV